MVAGRLLTEAAERVSGGYREQEWYDLAALAERAAAPLASAAAPATRMRAALLLAAVDREERAEQLFVAPLQGQERQWVKAAVEGWAAHSRARQEWARAQEQAALGTPAGEAEAERLLKASQEAAARARRLLAPTFDDPGLRRQLTSGPEAWSPDEIEQIRSVAQTEPGQVGAASGT